MALSSSEQATKQTQLAALDAAIAVGAKVLFYDNKRVEYRSLTEMYAIRDTLRGDLGLNGGAARQVRRTVTRYNGGF